MSATTSPAAARLAVQEAIEVLSRTQRGRCVMSDLLAFLDDSQALGLDAFGQTALVQLIVATYVLPGSTRDAMRDALEEI